MSVQLKTEEINNDLNANPVLIHSNASVSKIIELNGQKREVELIRIDDSAALDPEIKKYQSLRKSERTKEIIWFVASLVAVAAVAAIGFGLILTGVSLWFAPLIKVATLFAYFPLKIISDNYKIRRIYSESKINELKNCQIAMRNEEFRIFARSYFDSNLGMDQLLSAHRLFEKSRSLKLSLSDFYQSMNRLGQEFPNGCKLFNPGIGI